MRTAAENLIKNHHYTSQNQEVYGTINSWLRTLNPLSFTATIKSTPEGRLFLGRLEGQSIVLKGNEIQPSCTHHVTYETKKGPDPDTPDIVVNISRARKEEVENLKTRWIRRNGVVCPFGKIIPRGGMDTIYPPRSIPIAEEQALLKPFLEDLISKMHVCHPYQIISQDIKDTLVEITAKGGTLAANWLIFLYEDLISKVANKFYKGNAYFCDLLKQEGREQVLPAAKSYSLENQGRNGFDGYLKVVLTHHFITCYTYLDGYGNPKGKRQPQTVSMEEMRNPRAISGDYTVSTSESVLIAKESSMQIYHQLTPAERHLFDFILSCPTKEDLSAEEVGIMAGSQEILRCGITRYAQKGLNDDEITFLNSLKDQMPDLFSMLFEFTRHGIKLKNYRYILDELIDQHIKDEHVKKTLHEILDKSALSIQRVGQICKSISYKLTN